jgi:hypothetical protein
MTYRQWKEEVEMCLEELCGMSSEDLPDYAYRDAFDDGLSPEDTAEEVYIESQF